MNRHLSDATAAGELDDVAPAWDGDNGQWWDWYMSLAENGAAPTLLEVPPVSGAGGSSCPIPNPARSPRARGTRYWTPRTPDRSRCAAGTARPATEHRADL